MGTLSHICRTAYRTMMRSVLIASIVVVACIAPFSCVPHAAWAASDANVYDNIDSYLRSSVEKAHIPSLSAVIVDDDEVLFSRSYGACESTDTPFLLGSVSKSFTALCIMQLVEQERVDLDATLATYLPDATDGSSITIGQLLNHTSGLGEHQTLADYRIVSEQGVHSYANVNYTLLGKVIEAVTGRSYSDYLAENVLEPLRLSQTSATLDESRKHGLIEGFTNYGGLRIASDPHYPTSEDAWISVPAGYLSSSMNDLGSYLQMYLNDGDGLLSKESIDTMFSGDTVFVDGDVPYRYGYGWATIEDPLPEPVLRHSGLVETGTACVFILPERNIAVALAANVNDYFVTNGFFDEIGWGIVLMLLGEQPIEIADGAYLWEHAWIDLAMLAVLIAGVVSLCLLPRFKARIQDTKRIKGAIVALAANLLAAIALLLFIPGVFGTPLWVARSFVPDVYLAVVISSALFFVGGIIRSVLLIRRMRRPERIEPENAVGVS